MYIESNNNFRVGHLLCSALKCLWNVVSLRTKTIFIRNISHSVRLAIWSGPRVAALYLQSLILLSLVLQVSSLLVGCSITGLVATGRIQK